MKINFNLFKNNRKQADNHPDMKGNGKDEQGKEYDIAAWTKIDKNGNKYLSVTVSYAKPKDDHPAQQATTRDVPVMDDKDDLPF